MSICAICRELIVELDDSKEHIIPASIGGRKRVKGFLHRKCNSKAGETWDAELARQLQPLALQFGVNRQSGKTPKMKVTNLEGEEFLLGEGGHLAIPKPRIKKSEHRGGTSYQVTVGSMPSPREVMTGLKRNNPRIDIEASLASVQVGHSYSLTPLCLEIGFGGEDAGRSLVKSALALVHYADLPINLCKDALDYLGGTASACFGHYFARDLVAKRPPEIPIHCIAIEANPDTGLILGYGEYFGTHRAVLCLGHGYVGKAVRKNYSLNPSTGKTLDLDVDLQFNETDISAIFEGEMDNQAGRIAAFDAIFPAVLRKRQETQFHNEVNKAFKYARANYGGTPDAMLTATDQQNIATLFVKEMFPFLTEVMRWSPQTAFSGALSFARQVLAAAGSQGQPNSQLLLDLIR